MAGYAPATLYQRKMGREMSEVNLLGQRFGRLVVVEKTEERKNREIVWKCFCDCGNTVLVQASYLKTGHTKSCGCLAKELLLERITKHNLSTSPIYKKWKRMVSRCNYQGNIGYQNYGGRGIKVCNEWLGTDGFLNFYNWAINNGYKDGLTLERKNVNGKYEPQNCCWISFAEQQINKRNNFYISFNGETKALSLWCRELNLDYKKVHNRLTKLHWTVERAFSE